MKILLVLILLTYSFESYSVGRADDLKTILPEDIFGDRKEWGVSLAVGGDSHSGNVEKKRLGADLSIFKRFRYVFSRRWAEHHLLYGCWTIPVFAGIQASQNPLQGQRQREWGGLWHR